MAVRKKPKNDFGVELMAFCATYGLTYRDVATGADVKRSTLIECTTGRCAGHELIPRFASSWRTTRPRRPAAKERSAPTMRSTTAKFLFVEDVMQILGISQSKAYQIMRKINRELEAEGYETIAGRVPRRRFCEKFYCGDELLDQPPRQTKERREHNGKTKATRKAAGQ